MKFIKLILSILYFFCLSISCKRPLHSTQIDQVLSIDSISILRNSFNGFDPINIDSTLRTYFGVDNFNLLLECAITNLTLDTIVSESTYGHQTIFYIDRFLRIDSLDFECFSIRPNIPSFTSACDTFLPYEVRTYYIPIYINSNLEIRDKLYFQFWIRPGFLHCFSRYNLPKEFLVSQEDSVLFKSVILIDMKTNLAKVVNNPIDSIYEEYKAMPNMKNVSMIK